MEARQFHSATDTMPTDAWQADPIAGTTAIEVRHGGGTYRIENAPAIAEVLRTVRIAAIENGVGRGSKPPTNLIFHKASGSLRASLYKDGVLGTRAGLIHLKAPHDFANALARHIAAGKPVDLLKSEHPAQQPGAIPAPLVPASRRSLSAGFNALDVSYDGGPREGRVARITDPKVLDELHKALKVMDVAPPPPPGTPSSTREFTANSKDGSAFYADFLDAERFYAASGTYRITPDFVTALNEHLSRSRAGRST